MQQKRQVPIALPSTGVEEWEATRECFESGWLTQGPKVAAFEKAFAERHNVKHALAVSSCTTGLHLALAALGIGPGDEVIVPAFTWVATANAALYCGATPVLVDIEKETNNIDPKKIAAKINQRTKAVIVVHLFGLCADMDAIRAVVPPHVAIIEDAACAAGASYKGRPAGGLGKMGVFSFHPRKSITTGEGGMVTTDDDALASLIGQMRNHGAAVSEEQRHRGPRPYLLPDFDVLGYNYRMTDLQGSVGCVQLTKLDRFIQERQKWANYYRSALASLKWLKQPVQTSGQATGGQHAWQAYVCYVDPELTPLPRNDMMEFLQERGIGTRPGTHAVHTLTYYKESFGYEPEDFPNAHACEVNTLAIPLHNKMTEEDYKYVVESLLAVAECGAKV